MCRKNLQHNHSVTRPGHRETDTIVQFEYLLGGLPEDLFEHFSLTLPWRRRAGQSFSASREGTVKDGHVGVIGDGIAPFGRPREASSLLGRQEMLHDENVAGDNRTHNHRESGLSGLHNTAEVCGRSLARLVGRGPGGTLAALTCAGGLTPLWPCVACIAPSNDVRTKTRTHRCSQLQRIGGGRHGETGISSHTGDGLDATQLAGLSDYIDDTADFASAAPVASRDPMRAVRSFGRRRHVATCQGQNGQRVVKKMQMGTPTWRSSNPAP